MKKCYKCGEEKPMSEFSSNKSKKDGVQSECKKCKPKCKPKTKPSRDTIRRRKNKYKKNYYEHLLKIKGSCCCDCGHKFDYDTDKGLYHFHHIDPTTKQYNISHMIRSGSSLDRIKKELGKCVLLCKPCHIKRHKDFNSGLRETL